MRARVFVEVHSKSLLPLKCIQRQSIPTAQDLTNVFYACMYGCVKCICEEPGKRQVSIAEGVCVHAQNGR